MTQDDETFIVRVKSRLLPLPPWEAALEWLIERLPRSFVPVEIDATEDILVLDQQQGEYRATGTAPCFVLRLTSLLRRGGWYYLEAALVRNNGNREAALQVTTNDGAWTSIPIPTNLRGTVREVFFLPPDVRSLHWSPTAATGYFSQSPLLLHRITAVESLLRRLYRVVPELWRMRGRCVTTAHQLPLQRTCAGLHDLYLRSAQERIKRLVGNDYPTFIALHDTLRSHDIRIMHRQMRQWTLPLRVSLIMTVRAPVVAWLRQAIDSIVMQLYPHWELLLAGDIGSEIVEMIAPHGDRIRSIPVPVEADPAATLNIALAAANGDYMARVGQHDQLPQQALFLLVRELHETPDSVLVYGDEDLLDEAGNRCHPRFKPDWNPDLLTSYNYLGRLCLYNRELLRAIGGYRSGFEGAEDYDLCLRVICHRPQSMFRHVSRITCHCRCPVACTGTGFPATEGWNGHGHQAGKRALESFFAASSVAVEDGPAPELYRIRYPLPSQPPLVSIIIPSRDKGNMLAACVESIVNKTTYNNWEILVIDNQTVELSALAYLAAMQRDSRIRVFRDDHPFNFSALNNFAVEQARGEVLALVNNDIEVKSPDWLDEMVSHALRPGIGAVGAKLLYENDTIQHAGVILGIGGIAGHGHKYLPDTAPGYGHRAVVTQNLSAVTGACLVVRKAVYQEVGGLNATDFAVAFNDIDFCLRLVAKGYRTLFTPYAKLYHHESISRGRDDTPEKNALFVRESAAMKRLWGPLLQQDPAYNPNLSRDFEGFTLRIR